MELLTATNRIGQFVLLGAVIILTSCSSRPSKYKKKRGCDCPKWNLRTLPGERPIHANLDRVTATWPLAGSPHTIVTYSLDRN